jgi:glycosyltransferase involved in cell wall biosynthesis
MRVSAIIPCYNYGKYLARAIDSILAQTYAVSEILVIDDGSSDNTHEIAASFGNRVRYIFQQNAGRAAARNHGIHEATGDWIALLDADDWWLPNKIELQAQALAARPDAVVVYTSVRCQHPDGGTNEWPATDPSRLWPALRYANCITGSASAALIRRDVLLAEGGFDESLRECEDWDCWVRLARKYPFAAAPDAVTVLMMWPGSASTQNDRMLANTKKLMDKTLLTDLTGWRRMLWRHRIWSAALFSAAINARQQGRREERAWLFESLLHWPSPVFIPRRWWALCRNLTGISQPASATIVQ